jgi:hypothetical protein
MFERFSMEGSKGQDSLVVSLVRGKRSVNLPGKISNTPRGDTHGVMQLRGNTTVPLQLPNEGDIQSPFRRLIGSGVCS